MKMMIGENCLRTMRVVADVVPHTHDASDINSGILPITRGGTGAGTVAAALANLGICVTGDIGNLHVWKKTVVTSDPVPEVPASYSLGTSQRLPFAKYVSGSQATANGIYVSDDVSVDSLGNVTLVSPVRAFVRLTGVGNEDPIDVNNQMCLGTGKRFFQYAEAQSGSGVIENLLPVGNIYYVAPGTKYAVAVMLSDIYTAYFNDAQLVTGVAGTPAIPAGTTVTYPVSTNRNAYQEGSDAKPAGYTLGDVVTGSFQFATNSNYSVWYKVSDSLNVTDDGTVSLGAYERVSMRGGTSYSSSAVAGLKGKFIQLESSDYAGYVGSPFNNLGIYYIPADAVFSGGPATDRYQPVTGYASIPANTTIEYLGCLGDKPRMQYGTYIGTGTYGSSNPCTLTFDFPPKMVAIMGASGGSGAIFMRDSTEFSSSITGSNYRGTCSLVGLTLTFYNTRGESYQLNGSGNTYAYIAIG